MKNFKICNCKAEVEHCECGIVCKRCGKVEQDCKCCDTCESQNWTLCGCSEWDYNSKWAGFCRECGKQYCYCDTFDYSYDKYLEKKFMSSSVTEEESEEIIRISREMHEEARKDREFNYSNY